MSFLGLRALQFDISANDFGVACHLISKGIHCPWHKQAGETILLIQSI